MTAASFVRVECLLQCLQNQARLARLQAGNGAPRTRSYLANRADDTVYAQQSGALQGTVIAHGLREVSAVLRERETLNTSAPVTQTGTTLSLHPSFEQSAS